MLVVLGPTASGKSDAAMAIAAADPTSEIVAVDAMQVYRRMDIGTAKPSSADRASVVHHCLDVCEPSDDFSLTQYASAASAALADLAERGHRAIIVAGTGLYLRTITDPMEIPGIFPDVRGALEQRAHDDGGAEDLHRQLAVLDPTAAARMEPSNRRRVVRALEVTLGSGRPFSSFGEGVNHYPLRPFLQIGLRWPRPVLAHRIAERVDRMLAAGLVAEVTALIGEPAGLSRTARQALGYKELIEHLEGHISLDEARASIINRTRQFAVRQERWFRRDPRIRWVDIHVDPVAEVLDAMNSHD